MPLRPVLAALVLGFGLIACGGDTDADGKVDTEDTDTTPLIPTGDSSEPDADLTGQAGSIVLGEWPPDAVYADAGYYAAGLFVDADEGVINLAMCVLIGAACVDTYPAVGTDSVISTNTDFIYYSTFHDAGNDITAGDVTLSKDLSFGVPTYFGAPSAMPHDATGTLSFDGDLAPYDDAVAFTYTSPVAATAPDPLQPIVAGPGDTIDFAWAAGNNGDMFLEYGNAAVGSHLVHLDDAAGTYTLSVDDLQLAAPFSSQLVILARQTDTDVDAAGNLVRVQTRSEQWYYVQYEDTYGWTELVSGTDTAENCTAAAGGPALVTGLYYGDTSGNSDSHDVGKGNPTTDWPSAGNDAVVVVNLLANQTLTVNYTQSFWDASVYLLDGGCDVNSPLAGVDDTLDGQVESFTYTATAAGPVYLVLDAWTPGEGGPFSLDIDIQ